MTATDRVGNTTTYDYDYQHYLTAVHDPLSHTPLRNFYLPDGRLDYSLDAHNNKISFFYDKTNLEPSSNIPTNIVNGVLINGIPTTVPLNGQTITDQYGNPTVVTHDAYGNITSKTQFLIDTVHNTAKAITTTSEFSDSNNPDMPTRVYDPLYDSVKPFAHKMDFTYDVDGNQLTTTRYHIDENGNQQTITTKITYNSYGQPLTVTDANGIVTVTNIYDGNGNLVSSTDALGNTTTSAYDYEGNTASLRSPNGATVRFDYDTDGNTTGFRDTLGGYIQFVYDNNGNKVKQVANHINENGQTETLVAESIFDDNSELTKQIYPDGSSDQMILNSLGNISQSIDVTGQPTAYDYDDLENVTTTHYADGSLGKNIYDAAGRSMVRTDRSGRGTLTTYDSLERPIQQTYLGIDGNPFLDNNDQPIHTTTIYDDEGNIVQEIDENQHSSYHTYDDLGRETSITDAMGSVTRFEYDNNDRKIRTIDALGHSTSNVYDNAGHVISVFYPDGTTSSLTYDSMGHQTSRTDQSGHTKSFGYDILGHLITVTDALGHTTTFAYNDQGRKVQQTDANNHTTYFSYDTMGRLIKKTLPLGQYETMDYDAAGRLLHVTDYNGVLTTLDYEATTGRLLQKSASGQSSVTFTYNMDGSKASASRGNVTVFYSYDERGRVKSVTGPNGKLAYTYDSTGGKLSSNIYHDGSNTPSRTTTFTYDANNRLSSVRHNADAQATVYTYDKLGNRQSVTRPNGVVTTYQYDSLNRLTDVLNAGTGLASYHYTLAPNGRRIALTETGTTSTTTISYAFDDTDRLLSESRQGSVITYSYDAVGNRLQKTVNGQVTNYTYDSNDRLINEKDASGIVLKKYGYDANGAQTTINDIVVYGYDFEGHLITSPGSNYSYDADGHRISHTVGSTTINYLVDIEVPYASVVEELDGQGNLIASYDYGDDLIRMDRGSHSYYYIYDGHDDTRALTDGITGSVTDTYGYDAYGVTVHLTGTTLNAYLYNGQEFDSDTNLYNLRARYYSPDDGRFLSQDPEAGNNDDPISLHRYLYANDDPVNGSDPTGRIDFSLISSSIASAQSAMFDAFKAGATAAGRRKALILIGRFTLQNAISSWVAGELGINPIFFDLFSGNFVNLGEKALARWALVMVEHELLEEGSVVTARMAEASVGRETYSILRQESEDTFRGILNRLFAPRMQNNPWARIYGWGMQRIEWHHLVEQEAFDASRGITKRAINSILNVVPVPHEAHVIISAFFSSGRARGVTWLPRQFPTVRAYVQSLDWEGQWRFGLRVYQAVMKRENIFDLLP